MSGLSKYVLVDHEPVAEPDLYTWAVWYENATDSGRIRVATDQLYTNRGSIDISTVFLGLEFNLTGKGKPQLFETLVRGGGMFDGFMQRYATWDEAEEGHKLLVQQIKDMTIPKNIGTIS